MSGRLEVIARQEASPPVESLAALRSRDGARALASLALELSRARDADALRELILDKMLALFPGSLQVHLALADPREPSEFILHSRVRPRSSLPTGDPELLEVLIHSGRAALAEETPGDGSGSSRRVMAAPLIAHDGAVVGGVELAGDALTGQFQEVDLALLVSTAGILAASLRLLGDRERMLQIQKADLEQELALRVHRSFLPSRGPVLPGYSFHHACVPADRVGGDYHDFLPRPDGGWVMVVADVSGKGLSAALTMARLSAELRAQVSAETSLSMVLTRLNEIFRQLRKEVMYITCAFAALHPEEHRLEIALAGHPAPLLLRDGRVDPAFGEGLGGGLPLGLFGDGELLSPYSSTHFELAPGDRLLLYTDGLTEATNPHQEGFGTERLGESFTRGAGDLASVSRHLLRDVESFRAGQPADDDATLLLVQRDPVTPPGSPAA